MNEKSQRELQARVETFARDVTAILQRAVADAVKDALPTGGAPRGGRGGGGGGGKKAKAAKKAGRRRGGKQVSEADLLREISKQGGRRKEELAQALGTTTDAISGSMRALLDAKKVKASGKARGTKYTAV